MACAAQSMISANSYVFLSQRIFKKPKGNSRLFTVNSSAASSDESDCNVEECAPEKEVGKVSMEWLAGEKTKVVGTFPPRKRGWTGYIEKDTAGQTNIYSVEPTVYIAESAISSGTAGSSSEGSENTIALAAGLALISVAVASSVLIQVGKKQPVVEQPYNGPPLSYYISNFKPATIVEASVAPAPETTTVEASVTPQETPSSTVEASAPPQPLVQSTNLDEVTEVLT